MTSLNDQGAIRLLGLKFVDHMIKHLQSGVNQEVSKRNSRAIYTLLSKIIEKEGFLTDIERTLAYYSLVDVASKYPELLEINKKDSLELMDQVFDEFTK